MVSDQEKINAAINAFIETAFKGDNANKFFSEDANSTIDFLSNQGVDINNIPDDKKAYLKLFALTQELKAYSSEYGFPVGDDEHYVTEGLIILYDLYVANGEPIPPEAVKLFIQEYSSSLSVVSDAAIYESQGARPFDELQPVVELAKVWDDVPNGDAKPLDAKADNIPNSSARVLK